jgi:hypothetical protein
MYKLSILMGLVFFVSGIAVNGFGQPAFFSDSDNSEQNLSAYISAYSENSIPEGTTPVFSTFSYTLNDLKVEAINEAAVPEKEVSNIFAFTPSKLLKKNQVEAQLFNNLYTQTAYRDGSRKKIDLNSRDTYYGGLFYMLYGVSKSARINVGFDLNVKAVYIDTTKGNPLS